MKSIIRTITLAVLVVCSINVHAQNSQNADGIFLNEHDYLINNISYPLNQKTNDRLQLNEFFAGKHFSVRYNGKVVNFLKSDVYGYRLHGENFRFFNNEAYKIVDTIGFPLYSRQKLNQLSKGWMPGEKYFLSVDFSKPILNLTIENLCSSFPNQPSFRYNIQNYFSNDSDLKNYDKLSHEFKIKYFFLHQQQGKSAHAAL